jgi:hypothetical protein
MKNKKIPIIVAVFLLAIGIFFVLNKKEMPECTESDGEKALCWKNQFTKTLDSKGIDAAFLLLSDIYKKDQNFAASCHDYTHLIGEKASELYIAGENIKLDIESSYCGYGFYHGFIISLLKSGRDPKEAARFCNEGGVVAGLDCFHGMGHGFVDFNSSQLTSLEDIQVVINSGLKLCVSVSTKEEEIGRCKDGVYHSIFDVAMGDPTLIAITSPRSDPFRMCKKQKDEDRDICVMSSSTVIMTINDNDFGSALNMAYKELGSEAHAIIRQMAGYEAMLSLKNNTLESDISACKKLPQNLKEECIKGLVEGITDFGEPGREALLVKNFCGDALFNNTEKKYCHDHALDYFGRYLGPEKKENLCEIIGYQNCNEEN